MTVYFDHIAVALGKTRGSEPLKRLFALLGLRVVESDSVPEKNLRIGFVEIPMEASIPQAGTETDPKIGGNRPECTVSLELLESLSPESVLARFLETKGPGFHHICFRVHHGGLDPVVQLLASEGFQLLYPAPKRGARGTRINFVHPASTGGILVEILEPSSETPAKGG